MTDDMLLEALTASNLSPEEFGKLLAIATGPIDLDSELRREMRASARTAISKLPNGFRILTKESA